MKCSIPFMIAMTSALLLSSCVSTPPTDDANLSPKIIKQFFEKPQDPRRFGLTVYQSKYGPVFSGSKRLHDFQTAKAGFLTWRSDIPMIHVQSRKLELVSALVDTGSRDSWITMEGALLLAAEPLGPPPYRRQPDHVLEKDSGIAVYISKLRIEDLHIESMVAYLRVPKITLGLIARRCDNPKPDLVLGCDLLSQFSYVRFDYPQRCIYFSADQKYDSDPDSIIESAPFKKLNGTPAVDAVLDGVPARIIIDTAGDFEVAWNKPEGSVMRQLSIGDLVLRDVMISDAGELSLGYPEIPRIGNRLLRKFAVTLDSKRHQIVFERPRSGGSNLFNDDTEERKKSEVSDYLPD